MPALPDEDEVTMALDKSSLAQCLQRVSDAEVRLKTEFANIEGILQEVRSVFSECSGQGSRGSGADGYAIADAKHVVTCRDEEVSPAVANSPSVLVSESLERDDLVVNNANMLALAAVRDEVAEDLGISPEEVSRAYQVFMECDLDNSGKLDISEAQQALEKLLGKRLDEAQFHRILMTFDANSDASLSFEEFLFFYCHTPMKKLQHLSSFSSRVRLKGNRLSSSFRAQLGGVRTSHVKGYVGEELTQMAACMKLPVVIITFALFFIFCQLHGINGLIASGSQYAMKFHIEEDANFAFSGAIPFENGRMGHKTIYDVNTASDFWSWFGLGLVPQLFPTPGLSETRTNLLNRCTRPADTLLGVGFSFNGTDFPANASLMNDLGNLCQQQETPRQLSFENLGRRSPIFSTQSILAGVRLQQEQHPLSECLQPDLHGHAFEGSCTGTGKAWFMPELRNVMGMDKHLVDKPGASTEYFLSQTPQQDVMQRLIALENGAWMNQRTSKVELLTATYNPDTTMVTALYIYFGFNRAGMIHKFVKPVALNLTIYPSPWLYVVDALFCLSIIKIAIDEGRMLLRECKLKGFKNGTQQYFGFSQIVDWVVIVFGTYVCYCWVQDCLLRLQLSEHIESGDTDMPGTWAQPVDRIHFFELVDRCSESWLRQLLLIGIYSICLGMRFFDAFSGQPRLALVTNTLRAASVDVIHFGVVVGSVLWVFSLSAQMLFGFAIQDYGSFDRSLWTLFKSMVEGFDTSELSKMDRPVAALWGLIFTVLVQLLMLNMLMAIVLDIYGQVKSDVPPSAETFWSQAFEIFKRWNNKRLGRRISLQKVMDFLESRKCNNEFLTVPVLMLNIPGLGEQQAIRILTQADDRAAELESTDDATVTQQVHSIDLGIQQLQEMMAAMAACRQPLEGASVERDPTIHEI
eukprot:TRINITY_DN8977_c0_g1_i4.p1 TRINITY_DN8977_c0_g1~~TRINITY_DN8977_c0_g1_i4.p1  ORF type:complete len:919 (+),score=118.65 TRINITY_DN8977_c0_g1_i4:57-2813(+)